MNEENIKPLMKKLILPVLVILLIPILIFIANFYKHSVSDSISDWGAFGDFFGGILNTTISFLSLVILAFLTYFVSKQSDLEAKKTNILIRKIDAYHELTEYLPSISYSIFQISVRVKALTKHLNNIQDLYNVEYLKKMREQ
ncbi:hypothetical protein [Formosa algae]|uniref:hypothetical protein n=1 Tax=Formosa algae TaxID=225843 RepID=UPI000CCF4485|nr:hypothetical protein [Formosa algae]PNW27230.1 hypothetical protein BKP44_14155 [Formosa algae]